MMSAAATSRSPRQGLRPGDPAGRTRRRPAPRVAARAAAVLCALGALCGAASAETRVTLKAAKAGSSYYQMAVQLAEAMKAGTDGEVSVTVEESQGSVQNVMEAAVRPGNYVFTSPPALIGLARGDRAMFEGKGGERFDAVRALFPIPSLTMHFVASAESGVESLEDLAGKTLLLGKGSFGATEGEKYVGLFGLEGEVEIADAELSNAVAALKNGQIDAFVTAGSWPAPNVVEAAASTDVVVLSLTDEQVAETGRTRLEIPAGTYAGQDEPVVTTSLPVVAYATTDMDDDTAYALVKTYWENKVLLGEESAWWNGVGTELLANVDTELHPGAVRYYEEAGVALSDDQR